MGVYRRIDCTVCKIVSILVIFGAFGLPLYLYSLIKSNHSIFGMICLFFMSFVYLIFGVFSLLKTNDPAKRWNILTFNPRWSGKMKSSFSDDPSQLFNLDKISDEELLKINRDKLIKDILK